MAEVVHTNQSDNDCSWSDKRCLNHIYSTTTRALLSKTLLPSASRTHIYIYYTHMYADTTHAYNYTHSLSVCCIKKKKKFNCLQLLLFLFLILILIHTVSVTACANRTQSWVESQRTIGEHLMFQGQWEICFLKLSTVLLLTTSCSKFVCFLRISKTK